MNTRFVRCFPLCFAALALAVFLLTPDFAQAALPREKGATYLEDFLDQPYRLKVLADSPIYFNSDLARFLGTMQRGQLVELQAIGSDGRIRVRGNARQGQVVGWMEAANLSPLDPAFVDGLRRSARRRERVKTLIASNEIALGMTSAEVAASLGVPTRKASRVEVGGASETWEYIRYVRVPRQVAGVDAYGRYVASIVYERVPAGTFSVIFSGDLVSAIEQNEGRSANALAATQVQSVPAPVSLHF